MEIISQNGNTEILKKAQVANGVSNVQTDKSLEERSKTLNFNPGPSKLDQSVSFYLYVIKRYLIVQKY